MVRGDKHGPVHAKPVRAPEGLLGSNVARLSIKTSTSGAKQAGQTARVPLSQVLQVRAKKSFQGSALSRYSAMCTKALQRQVGGGAEADPGSFQIGTASTGFPNQQLKP